MSNSEPQGCLSAILKLFGIPIGGPSQEPGELPSDELSIEELSIEELPYRQRDAFLSPAEFSFYRVLTTAIGNSYVVCPKVNLADVFFVKNCEKSQSYRNKIDRKHVDFLLCDPKSMRPILGVELDDSSHNRRDRQDRDEFVDQVFKAAGLPLLHVRAAVGYNPQNLSDLVRQTVSGVAGSKTVVAHEDGTPVCQKCGTQMVLRTAKKGDQQGEKFWGCTNYPKCRETKKL